MGMRIRNKKNRCAERFVDLGMVVAKRLITRKWKAPNILAWERSMAVWAGAESSVLGIEETKGLRKFPIANEWAEMLGILETNISRTGSAAEEISD